LNAEQAALFRQAEEGLGAARLLLGSNFVRSAVSEAYYAMFNAAKAALIGKRVLRHKHSAVIAAFGQHFAKPGVVESDLHQWLISAEKDRLIADYETGRSPEPEQARRHVEHAERFVARIKAYLAADPS
jgi:hypothetical protein